MQQDRENVIIYTTAVCNLKCSYCYIDKNSALKKIDDILEESFKGDYYIDFIKKMFPDKHQLKSIETWGGEPFIAMHRCYNLLQQLIDNYPNFESFFSSTNLTTPDWLDEFSGLIDVFASNPNRKFFINLQVSIDGPEYINDRNRGKGTTKKIKKTFDKLAEYCKTIPSNIDLQIHPKPTFDMGCFELLNTDEKIIEYYQYLETYIDKINSLNKSNVRMTPNIPNTASPMQHTVNDGKLFADFCRRTKAIEKRNEKEKLFKYYNEITLYSSGFQCQESKSYKCTNFTCGTGFTSVGFLPYDKISTCHNGFVDLISDYKKYATENKDTALDFRMFVENNNSRFCLTEEEYALYESQMDNFNMIDTTARMVNNVGVIVALALAGQVDEKYKEYDKALEAAQFIRNRTSFCVRDNYAVTGTMTMQPLGLLKLLLNGAKEVIENDK